MPTMVGHFADGQPYFCDDCNLRCNLDCRVRCNLGCNLRRNLGCNQRCDLRTELHNLEEFVASLRPKLVAGQLSSPRLHTI